jgi:hypothetical protein
MKTLKSKFGSVQFNEEVEAKKAAEFLDGRFPGGWGEREMARAIKALERQAMGKEVGALAREFA